MRKQIDKYTGKLIASRSALIDKIAFAAQDDTIISVGEAKLCKLAASTLEKLNCLAICAALPTLPFAEFLLQRTTSIEKEIIPRDTETRTFLHDIPIVRKSELTDEPAALIAKLLGSRKGIIVEGIGIIAAGAMTIEQAFINWSSVFHSTFIKYLEDVLKNGFLLSNEAEEFSNFRQKWLLHLNTEGLEFKKTLNFKGDILDEIACVGRYTVERGLVDSFFGNISATDKDLVYISQTAASLDELEGCIDPVPYTNSSTVGITASSELSTHRKIFETTGCQTILHGHPRFPVIISMLCEEQKNCQIENCWKDCKKLRFIETVPIVAGEIGAGGIAKSIPPVIGAVGAAIVYGHGVFTIGENGFEQAFSRLVNVENICRTEYFRRFDEKQGL